jgi:citrate synthase
MRGLIALVWEGSVLDANEGIRFHGMTIEDCDKALPKGKTGSAMLPEAMFWLLLTGKVPSQSQIRAFSRELAEKAVLPRYVETMLDNFPANMHPMTQLATAVASLNHESVFAKRYEQGMNKADYWEPIYDDSITLIAQLPVIAAKIYQNAYKGGGALPAKIDPNEDWGYNYAALLGRGGKEDVDAQDLIRLYLALHGDHEGGNASAHTTHLVGSTLSDPYLSYSAGLLALAGPLHGYDFPFWPSETILTLVQSCRTRSVEMGAEDAIPYRYHLQRSRYQRLPLEHLERGASCARLRPRRTAPTRSSFQDAYGVWGCSA